MPQFHCLNRGLTLLNEYNDIVMYIFIHILFCKAPCMNVTSSTTGTNATYSTTTSLYYISSFIIIHIRLIKSLTYRKPYGNNKARKI